MWHLTVHCLSPVGGNISFVSLNCKGLNNSVKWSKIRHYMEHFYKKPMWKVQTSINASVDGLESFLSFSKRTGECPFFIHTFILFTHPKTTSDTSCKFVINYVSRDKIIQNKGNKNASFKKASIGRFWSDSVHSERNYISLWMNWITI